MAVPTLPPALDTGDVVSNTRVDATYDLLQWFRDTRPIFKGQAWSDDAMGATLANDATNQTFGFGEATAFHFAPTINVGSFTTASADADPESLVVPEAGIYIVSANAHFETASATGKREVSILKDGSVLSGSYVAVDAGDTAVQHRLSTGFVLADCAASTEFDVRVYQNSGASMDVTVIFQAIWVQST